MSGNPQLCETCNVVIRLEQSPDGQYFLRCACPKQVAVPETWNFESWE